MIVARSLSKKFKLYRSPADRMKEIILGKKYHTDFQSLNDVSFSVADGETLGIIGQNGAGKSTLLKILTGILLPDSGSIFIDGKITGLLELGTGFNTEMTGVENIFMNGAMLGMSREQIGAKKTEIINFSELGEFIFEPIKTYSSGMVMRLAFSVAIHAEPRCFVVDEALSVGDAYFQQKCMTKIRKFREDGGSIIFVSHDLNAVKMLCDKAILLDHGKVVSEGDTESVVNRYNFIIAKLNDKEGNITKLDRDQPSYGTLEAKITSVVIAGVYSKSDVISSGEIAEIRIHILANSDLDDVTVGVLIRDKFGQDIFGTNTFYQNNFKINLKKGVSGECLFRLRMDIGVGKYTLTTALHSKGTHIERCFHWVDNITSFEIAGSYGNVAIGLCKLYPEVEFTYADPEGDHDRAKSA